MITADYRIAKPESIFSQLFRLLIICIIFKTALILADYNVIQIN